MEILRSESENFLSFAEGILRCKCPIPMRRFFSLMRHMKCSSAIYSQEKCSFERNNYELCEEHFYSCVYYRNLLNNSAYNYQYTLDEKECFRFFFFSRPINDLRDALSIEDDELMGYLLVHQDSIKNKTIKKSSTGDPFERIAYTPQCLINSNLFPDDWHFISPNEFSLNLKIDAVVKTFNLRAHYFCQKNRITDTYTHAAIKMSLKYRYPKITCEKINEKAGINHSGKMGNCGLRPSEYKKVIEELTDSEVAVYLLKFNDTTNDLEFWHTIYMALNSFIPIILLFDVAEEDADSGHAVAVIGHTLNKHNWWSYDLIENEKMGYSPSLFWCDNMILQDDRRGPYYLLSKSFRDFSRGVPKIRNKLLLKWSHLFNSFSDNCGYNEFTDHSLYAIILSPTVQNVWENILSIEPNAKFWLDRFLKKLEDRNLIEEVPNFKKESQEIKIFNRYFYEYYNNSKLILRTLLISKSDYLKSIADHKSLLQYKEAIQNILPEYIFVTEISIPELFWINYRKVGEIVMDSNIGEKPVKQRDEGVLFVRLPNLIAFTESKLGINYVNQSRIHYRMIALEEKDRNSRFCYRFKNRV